MGFFSPNVPEPKPLAPVKPVSDADAKALTRALTKSRRRGSRRGREDLRVEPGLHTDINTGLGV